MKKNFYIIKIIIIYLFLFSNSIAAKSEFFDKGKKLFEKKKFEKSKILFERDIVFNPRSEKSYLYLAKIFKKDENDDQQENNLNTVLLLNPQNDEALYMLALLKIKQSDYNQTKELLDKLVLVCKSFCEKKVEIEEKLKKLTPENAKNNN